MKRPTLMPEEPLFKLITMTVIVYIACSALDFARFMMFKLAENLSCKWMSHVA